MFHLIANDDVFGGEVCSSDYGSVDGFRSLCSTGASYKLEAVPLITSVEGRLQQNWVNYTCSYLSTHALQDQPAEQPLGRVRRAAEAICELDGDSSHEAIRDCVRELAPLAAANSHRMPFTEDLL